MWPSWGQGANALTKDYMERCPKAGPVLRHPLARAFQRWEGIRVVESLLGSRLCISTKSQVKDGRVTP